MEGRLSLAGNEPRVWRQQVQAWEELGATHLSVGTGGSARRSPQEHIDALQRFKKVMNG